MKKSLILTALMFVLSAALISAAHGLINQRKDAVTIEETVLYGDRAAAEGITVRNSAHWDYHLFWDTVYTVGGELDYKTDFKFFQEEKRWSTESQPQLQIFSNFNFSIGGNNISFEPDDKDNYYAYSGMALKSAEDVATRTPAGETREEEVYVRDYYEYYPLTLNISFPRPYRLTGKNKIISEYLSIPVSENHRIKVSVTKDAAGNVTRVQNESITGDMAINSASIVTDSGFYYAMTFYQEGVTRVNIPEAVSGIHILPLVEKDGIVEPLLEEMRLVYPLPDSVEVLNMEKSPDGSRMLLFTRENDSIVLSSIDMESMTLLQKTELTSHSEDIYLLEIKQYDTFTAVILSDGRFYILVDNDAGGYDVKLTGNLYEYTEIDKNYIYGLEMDYDGRRLAVAATCQWTYIGTYGGCGTYLLVYDEDGLAYAGKYDHSADRTIPPGEVREVSEALKVSCN